MRRSRYVTHRRWILVSLLFLLPLFSPYLYGGPLRAQEGSQLFPETGKTVRGKFLTYWTTRGGLTQQGYPISEEMQEKSDTDGKMYTVQYFERAVFELHPQNQPPGDVLLQLLGVFRYKQKYPSGAAGQTPNTSAGSVLFPETGKRLGGLFLDYWKAHGDLPQQGYPISDEFQEKSALDGKVYTVQYFERAVFEHHPDNQPPYNVLLSQLGAFRYKAKYQQPAATPTPAPPVATATSVSNSGSDCAGIPASQNSVVTPSCGPAGSLFSYVGSSFQPGERVGVYITRSDGKVIDAGTINNADERGQVTNRLLSTSTNDPVGIWAITMEGANSHARAIGYIKLTMPVPSDCSGIPENARAQVLPNCIKAGESLRAQGFDFYSLYDVQVVWSLKSPSGRYEFGGYLMTRQGKARPIQVVTDANAERGVWKVLFDYSYPQSEERGVGYFKVLPP